MLNTHSRNRPALFGLITNSPVRVSPTLGASRPEARDGAPIASHNGQLLEQRRPLQPTGTVGCSRPPERSTPTAEHATSSSAPSRRWLCSRHPSNASHPSGTAGQSLVTPRSSPGRIHALFSTFYARRGLAVRTFIPAPMGFPCAGQGLIKLLKPPVLRESKTENAADGLHPNLIKTKVVQPSAGALRIQPARIIFQVAALG